MHQAMLWETVVNKQTTATALMGLTPGTHLLHINDHNAEVLWSPLSKEISASLLLPLSSAAAKYRGSEKTHRWLADPGHPVGQVPEDMKQDISPVLLRATGLPVFPASLMSHLGCRWSLYSFTSSPRMWPLQRMSISLKKKNQYSQEFPGGTVMRTPSTLSHKGERVWSLVGELRFCKPWHGKKN